MKMLDRFEQMTFDSELFGKKIASCTYESENDWKVIDPLIKKNSTDLLYLNSLKKITRNQIEHRLNCSVSYCDDYDLAQLELLAIGSGLYSRFFQDKRLNTDHAKKLYRLWINKLLSVELADDI